MSFTPAFGRIPEWDDQNEKFLIADSPIMRASPSSEVVKWACKKVLNQRATPRCTAFCGTTELIAMPVPVAITKAEQFAGKVHRRCGDSRGASILSVVKDLKEHGYYNGFYWAKAVNDIQKGLWTGPGILGIEWWDSMNYPKKDGFLRSPAGEVLGLHCLLLVGMYRWDYVVAQNTWGTGFGINGRCLITLPILAQLIAHPLAEICFPTGRRIP